jgi:KDO2-lipid IV(A) lauroyltransferase
MTATLPRFRHRLEAAAARLLLGTLARRDMDAASDLGAGLVRRIGPFTRAHRTAVANLAAALPHLSTAERDAVLNAAWDNLGRTTAEYAVIPRLWREGFGDRIEVTGHEPLEALGRDNKPALLFSAHLGNWEIIPLALAKAARPLTIVYRPPNNRTVDGMIGDVRAPYTAGMAPKGAAGARMILKALDRGEQVFMVVDQKINAGLEIPFFGRGAFTGPAIVLFAMRNKCPVFPVRCIRTDRCRFTVRVEEPWHFEGEADDENAVRAGLLRVNQRLETWIREHPGQWLWMHKRWPR